MDFRLQVQFPNGDIFEVSPKVVAHRRAVFMVYHIDRELLDYFDYDEEYKRYFDEGLADEQKLLDYIKSMKWSDLLPYALRVFPGEKPNYNRMYSDATFRVAERNGSNE